MPTNHENSQTEHTVPSFDYSASIQTKYKLTNVPAKVANWCQLMTKKRNWFCAEWKRETRPKRQSGVRVGPYKSSEAELRHVRIQSIRKFMARFNWLYLVSSMPLKRRTCYQGPTRPCFHRYSLLESRDEGLMANGSRLFLHVNIQVKVYHVHDCHQVKVCSRACNEDKGSLVFGNIQPH